MNIKLKLVSVCFILCSFNSRSQNGLCLKYTLVTRNLVTDTLQVFSLAGNSFNQMTRVSDGEARYRSIKLKEKAAESYVLYADNSYRMIPDVQMKEYEVKVLGKEEVNGYSCTKISLVTFSNGNVCYLWLTEAVANYKDYMGISVLDFKLDRLNEALQKIKVSGFPVKIAYKVPDYMTYEFVNASTCDVKPDLFDLTRYTKTPPAK